MIKQINKLITQMTRSVILRERKRAKNLKPEIPRFTAPPLKPMSSRASPPLIAIATRGRNSVCVIPFRKGVERITKIKDKKSKINSANSYMLIASFAEVATEAEAIS